MSSPATHSRGSDGCCPACGQPNPCNWVLIHERDQREDDRLRTNLVDQFRQAGTLPRSAEVRTRTERLVNALQAAGAPESLLWMARDGVYEKFSSKRANSHGANLITMAERYGLWDIAHRALAGEFDAP